MAEALGVAASGIAVAQVAMVVGKSVIALRYLWKDVKDVPQNISNLMQQIEVFDPLLGAMEQNSSALGSVLDYEGMMGPAMGFAHKARDKFVSLVEELSCDINMVRKRKKMIARIKVVLGQSQLAKYEARLRGAIQLLALAHQTYML
jgi:hypothetical protein